jgi:hypothetical protein
LATRHPESPWTSGGEGLTFATTTDALTPDHLWTVSAASAAPVDETSKLDATVTRVVNDPHGGVWVQMNKGTIVEVYRYSEGKLEPAYRWSGGVAFPPVFSPFVSGTEVLAFNVGDPTHATNVAVVRGSELRRITHEGEDTLAQVELGEVRAV